MFRDVRGGAAVARRSGSRYTSGKPLVFCRAWARLSSAFLDGVDALCACHTEMRVEDHDRWRRLQLKLVDGTSFQLLDTPENQQRFPSLLRRRQVAVFPR